MRMASVRNVSVTYLGRKKITKRMQKLIHDIRFFLFWGANRNNFDDVRMILISNEGKTKYTYILVKVSWEGQFAVEIIN